MLKYLMQLPKAMKFYQNVPYMYVFLVQKLQVCALRLDSVEENIKERVMKLCIPDTVGLSALCFEM